MTSPLLSTNMVIHTVPAVQNNEVSTAQTVLTNLESQEAAAVASVLQSYESSRPYSSKTSWKGKQEEFIRWCSAKGYPSDAVNANKFILFLQRNQRSSFYETWAQTENKFRFTHRCK